MGRSVAALLLVFMTGSARADAPLTAADVARFLKAGISEPTILLELQSRGFGEPLDATREATLREAGASETLMVAIRRVAPAPPAAPKSVSVPPSSVYAPGVLVTPMDGQEPTFAVATRTVRVPVAVLDAKGRPVLGLHDADFKISEDGKRQGVTLFSGERRPLRLVLALDVSRSMENKVRQVEEALKHFIDLLEPADEILVMTFNDRLHIVQDFTSDRQLLAGVLDNLEPAGGTALYDAAFESIRRVSLGPRGEQGRGAGDGRGRHGERGGLRRPARVREALGGAGVLDRSRQRRGPERPVPPAHGPGRGGGAGGWPGVARRRRRTRRLARRRRTGGGCRAAALAASRGRPLGTRDDAEGFDDEAAHRARRRHRRSGRDRQGAAALHARQRRLSGERPAQAGRRVDRDDAAAPLPAGLRAARRQARLARRSGSRSTSRTRRPTPARATTRAADRLLPADLRPRRLHGGDQLRLAHLAVHLLGRGETRDRAGRP